MAAARAAEAEAWRLVFVLTLPVQTHGIPSNLRSRRVMCHVLRLVATCHGESLAGANVPMSNACPNVCSLKLLPALAAKLREANTA